MGFQVNLKHRGIGWIVYPTAPELAIILHHQVCQHHGRDPLDIKMEDVCGLDDLRYILGFLPPGSWTELSETRDTALQFIPDPSGTGSTGRVVSKQRCVSIGFIRDDGDFRLLATLNNTDEEVEDAEFDELVERVAKEFARYVKPSEIEVLDRQDADDYLATNDEGEIL